MTKYLISWEQVKLCYHLPFLECVECIIEICHHKKRFDKLLKLTISTFVKFFGVTMNYNVFIYFLKNYHHDGTMNYFPTCQCAILVQLSNMFSFIMYLSPSYSHRKMQGAVDIFTCPFIM